MDCLPGPKKGAIVGRWPLAEATVYVYILSIKHKHNQQKSSIMYHVTLKKKQNKQMLQNCSCSARYIDTGCVLFSQVCP